ncbi:hypothetical protein GWI33_001848 [Rhynchophorus ferrugineus]|uniref:Uncharacterized protein n=1 Tax=Rhynchophorus ferrugineus TaxID=354439 RepID=A0A834MJW3_RHYFE|nr:hypothetical protein GWI33_001848 [Rhynchophorus ferrugineus]
MADGRLFFHPLHIAGVNARVILKGTSIGHGAKKRICPKRSLMVNLLRKLNRKIRELLNRDVEDTTNEVSTSFSTTSKESCKICPSKRGATQGSLPLFVEEGR